MVNRIVTFVIVLLFTLGASASISITSHQSINNYWLAYAVNGTPSLSSFSFQDSGNYSSWKEFTATNWGYWVFNPSTPIIFPISFRLTTSDAEVTILNVFSSAAPGTTQDTGISFPPPRLEPTPTPTGASTELPTQTPTQEPTEEPTQPTEEPTEEPTEAPTHAPSTQQPTQEPTEEPTEEPTRAPTQAPTRAPTQQPTQAPTQQPTQEPTQEPTHAATPSNGNPFAGTEYYLNPHYISEVEYSIHLNPAQAAKMAKVEGFASAFWIDRMGVIDNVTTILTQARMQSRRSGNKVMVALVVYDLPTRDCAALASNGEIACADATCAAGISTYKFNYIDEIYKVLAPFPDLEIVTIIEPDSLPNLATNLGNPKCVLAQNAYITGVAYAIQKLSALSNVHIYVDAAHGGWLGWESGRTAAVAVFSQVLTLAGGASKIRGFSTNVANYQPLGSMTDTADPCGLKNQWNFGFNEVRYVSLLDASFAAAGITGMHYIIDTGRNGVINARTDCSNWCNINRAGLGMRPTSDTASSGLNNIDAYFWVKPPGESDGSSDPQAPRYDAHCGSTDSVLPAPQAGQWFSDYFSMLVNNASPSL